MESHQAPPAALPTVLLVEEDVLVRMPIAAYLRDCGYRVVEAASGTEALMVLRQTDVTVDALFTDAQLSGAPDGFGLVRWVRQNRPDARIVMAGNPRRAAKEAAKLCEEGPMLAKPYEPEIVERRIRQLLAKRTRLN
jgi:CheY-like chemotaxis protein